MTKTRSELLSEYDLLGAMGTLNDPVEFPLAVAKAVGILRSIKAELDRKPAATETVKVDDAYTAAAKVDEDAKAKADAFLKAIATQALESFEDSPNVWFHLRENPIFRETITNEIEYHRFMVTRTVPKVSTENRKAELAEDGRELLKWLKSFVKAHLDIDSISFPAGIVRKGKDGIEPDFDGIKGNYERNDSSNTGRHAKSYSVEYSLDGFDSDPITDPRSALRAVFTGTDRIGQKVADLNSLVDTVWSAVMNGETKTVEMNGKVLSIRKGTKDETPTESE